jgi:hypothetical protein
VHFYNVEAMANPPRATIWSAEPHTFAKHRVLRRYLDAWIPIMGQSYSGRGRVIVIDGFAGFGTIPSRLNFGAEASRNRLSASE